MTQHTIYTQLVELYRQSRTMLNNSMLERQIEKLEEKADDDTRKKAVNDAYNIHYEITDDKSTLQSNCINIRRIDSTTPDELLNIIYTMKPVLQQPFNQLFSSRRDYVSFYTVKGDSMEPLLNAGDTVTIYKTQEIHEEKISLIEVKEGKVLKRIIVTDEGYLLKSDNSKHEPMWVQRHEFNVIGVVTHCVRGVV